VTPILTWSLKGGLVIGLLAGWWLVHQMVAGLGQQVAEQRLALEQSPQEESYQASLRSELGRRSFDIERIRKYVLRRDKIVDVVAAIEEEGKRYGVVVEVPDIAEELELGEGGVLVEPTGPLQDVRMRVEAWGEPSTVISWLHGVEHLPYLLYIRSWDLKTGKAVPARGVTAPTAAGRGEAAPVYTGYVDMAVIVSMEKE